jgi:hypothetical protein
LICRAFSSALLANSSAFTEVDLEIMLRR